MPTLVGLRRRGYTPEAIRDFCFRVGVAKAAKVVDVAFLEHCLREDLNRRAERRMAVLRPLKLVIENYPEGQVEALDAVNNPEDPSAGSRKVPAKAVGGLGVGMLNTRSGQTPRVKCGGEVAPEVSAASECSARHSLACLTVARTCDRSPHSQTAR